jgi:hypothetical protein
MSRLPRALVRSTALFATALLMVAASLAACRGSERDRPGTATDDANEPPPAVCTMTAVVPGDRAVVEALHVFRLATVPSVKAKGDSLIAQVAARAFSRDSGMVLYGGWLREWMRAHPAELSRLHPGPGTPALLATTPTDCRPH